MITVKEETTDLAISRDDLLRLSQYQNTACISIYIPTHRGGEETLRGQDPLNLKNQLKQVKNKLLYQGLTLREAEKLVSPVMVLIDDPDFWRHQSEGLAVFVSEDIFEKYTVPVVFDELNYISGGFYLKQLLPLFNDNRNYFLLTLQKNDVRFYEGNKYGITEIDMEGIIPSRLEDSVGYDYEQKQLQFRTQLGGNKPGSFHGHGENESREKSELLVFLRDVDRGIMSKLHDMQQPPLLLCCLDHIYPVYREACTHKNLFPDFINLNPNDLDERDLHAKAWQVLEPHFNKEFLQRKERYMIGIRNGKASSNIREIVPAAIHGKVDTIFIERKAEIYGTYDLSTGVLSIQEEQNLSNVSLINLAAKKVFEQGGTVYLTSKEDLPDHTADVNALFRY